MDNFNAFLMGQKNRGKELMVFDWEKAAKLIKEKQPKVAAAGLQDDWEYTGGEIYKEGSTINKKNTYTYLASTWAIPELALDGEVIPCFKMQSQTPKWDADTYWPKEALEVLNS